MFRIRPSLSRISCQPHPSIKTWIQQRFAGVGHGGAIGRRKGQKDHWTEERLQSSGQYPLSIALRKVLDPKLEPSRKKHDVHVRTQIVSPDLCDDVLKYVGHTLEKHKGCDILDINPGAGLWSQKLHEFLNPRSHVLLEPQYKKFQSFLDPLLTAPDSKYSLVVKEPCELDTFRELVSEGVFPHQTPRDAQHPQAQEHNNTLLVTGSLVWDPIREGLGFDSMAKQLFHHFASAARTNDLFHAFGLVRTLFWVQHDDFGPIIANSIASMQKANRLLEMTHNLNVVVNSGRTHRKLGKGSSGREPQYEIESTVRALKAGREKGMELPPHRRDHVHDFAEDIEKASNGTGIGRSVFIQDHIYEQQLAGRPTVGLIPETIIEHYEEDKSLRSEYPDINLDRIPAGPGKKKLVWTQHRATHPAKEQVNKFLRKRASIMNIFKMKADIETTADIGEEMYFLECRILAMEDGQEKEASIQKLEEMNKAWQHGVDNTGANYGAAPLAEIDDRLAIRSPPYPRIQWDHRAFEPLIMSPSEAWPQNRLSLISAEPIPKNPAQDSDCFEWVHDFVFGLYTYPTMPISSALDKMQHGLSDIIKACPALKDPKKGGRLQMDHLRVRMLTVEMIEELVAAYRNWPFKAPGSDHNKYFRHKGATQSYGRKAQ